MKSVIHEHILVCLSSAPSNGNTIRTAAQMWGAFGGTLTALYVQTKSSDQMSADDRLRLQKHTRLAEKLGATISTISGDDVAYQIAEFARLSKVTKIVIGRSTSARHLFAQKNLTEKLIELTPHLDIYIIPDIGGENTKSRAPRKALFATPSVMAISITGGSLALSTAAGFLFEGLGFTEANIITIYILGVLLTALFTRNSFCSILSSLLSVLLFNFLFAAPRFTFYAYETGYPLTFAITLVAALITNTMAKRLADNAKQSSQAAWRTKALLDTSQQLQKATAEDEILQVIAAQLLKLLNRPLVLWPEKDGQLGQATSFSPEQSTSIFEGEYGMAAWAFRNQKRAGASSEILSDADGAYYPIRSNGEVFGVVGFPMRTQPLEPFENSILLSILGEGALAIENYRNARQKEKATIMAENEQLRANLLRSISHDLRTPLTSISGNAENLLTNSDAMEQRDRQAVLMDIYEDSVWLIRMTENLLALTRIGEEQTQLNKTTELVDEVITESLRHIRSKTHIIETDIGDDILLAQMDARLISQVINNLVDNAIKYTPDGSTICVCAKKLEDHIVVSVTDHGPGIPDDKKPRIFDMFYTSNTRVADGRRSMGLGLHLCKTIVTLHGGEITLTDNSPTGCVFSFTLPISEVPIYE